MVIGLAKDRIYVVSSGQITNSEEMLLFGHVLLICYKRTKHTNYNRPNVSSVRNSALELMKHLQIYNSATKLSCLRCGIIKKGG